MPETKTTHAKALEINLDPSRYGSIAEIGAGQEVCRWFFRVGAAAGTIAKTMSAYDKEVSDAIYGSAERYVSSGRLQTMLDHEYDLLVERLDGTRGSESEFFAFADTVSAQNYRGDADCHGWMGIRFQTHPRAEPSEIILHARMIDRDALMQHEALGILGVNLIHSAYEFAADPKAILRRLLDNVGAARIEIDTIEFSGAAFEEVDHRVISLRLVEYGLCRAAMLSASGEVLRPSEVLYKKSVILQRGRFRPPTIVHADIQKRALERMRADSGVEADRLISIREISVDGSDVLGGPGLIDFLDRLDALSAEDHVVLITDCPQPYLIAEYLARYSATQIGIPLGGTQFHEMMNEGNYEGLAGGILEAMGRLFSLRVLLYVYPDIAPGSGRRVELDSIDMPKDERALFQFLQSKGYVRALEGLPDAELRPRSDDVLTWLKSGDARWEDYVTREVAASVKSRGLFGYSA